jgi:hypothetical protein
MEIVLAIIIFSIVLFLYLHIYFQLKKSNDLEIYEIDKPSKEKLEEICDLRQPLMFDFTNERINEMCNLNYIQSKYGAFDIKVRNLKNNDDESELYIPLTLNAALELFKKDNNKKYFMEKNHDFLEETGLIKCCRYNDTFLRPSMVSSCEYDILSGTSQITTPLKYDINYRNYYLVTQGKIKIKLTPPKSKKYLYPICDYENFEFKSPVNVWNIQDEYKSDFDKIKCLEIELVPGNILFIPPFWWYSIKFEDNTSVSTFKYRTYMNTLANSHLFIMKMLQSQNIKRNVLKNKNISQNQNNDHINETIPNMSNLNSDL